MLTSRFKLQAASKGRFVSQLDGTALGQCASIKCHGGKRGKPLHFPDDRNLFLGPAKRRDRIEAKNRETEKWKVGRNPSVIFEQHVHKAKAARGIRPRALKPQIILGVN